MGNDDLSSIVAEVKSRKRLVPRDYGIWELAIIGGMLVTVWLPLFVLTWTADKISSLWGDDEPEPVGSDQPRPPDEERPLDGEAEWLDRDDGGPRDAE